MYSGIWISVALLSVLYGSCSCNEGGDFGYDGPEGPEFWPEHFPACGGKYQSPINIAQHLVQYVDLPLFKFTGYDILPETSTLTNNGHTVMLQLNASGVVTVNGGPLQSEYVFAQLHFHWGANDSLGSEDTINGHSFPMELHIVSFKKDYGSAKEAGNYKDGLAVMAFFFELDDTENPFYAEIVDSLPQVNEPDAYVRLKNPLSLSSLMGSNKLDYYSYHGSLTTPPCSEVVTWIDFEQPIMLSHAQIDEFRKIHSHEGVMTHNYRPTQPLGERLLWYNRGGMSSRKGTEKSAAVSINASILITLVLSGIVSRCF